MARQPWKPRPLVITPVETVEQVRAHSYVCTAGFGSVEEADRLNRRRFTRKSQHPLYDGALSRLGWWGPRVVGHVGVMRFRVRLGRALLPFAGIAGVCTDPRERDQGIASALMRDALAASREAGLSFSILFGIPNFYHRFGFVPAWAGHNVLFFTDTMKHLPGAPRWRARKARPADVPRMLKLYNCLYGQMDGSAVREPRVFLHRRKDVQLALDGPRSGDWAYAILRRARREGTEQLEVIEASGQGTDWEVAVMREAARQAQRHKMDKVTFRLPAAHPICRRAIFCNAIIRTEHACNAAAMAAVLDFAGLASQMAAEWHALLAKVELRVPPAGLAVRLGDRFYRWWPDQPERGARELSQPPRRLDAHFNDALARLVIGYGHPEAVMKHYGMQASEAVLPLLRAIFPTRTCAYSAVDSF